MFVRGGVIVGVHVCERGGVVGVHVCEGGLLWGGVFVREGIVD